MRIVRIACYSFLPALLLILASGRLLKVDRSPVSILLGAGLVLFSAAVSVLVHRRQSSSYRKLLLYLACAGLITAVQITGGYGSVLYFIYLIFLLWVALPSVGGLATEMGLIIGLTGSLALLNSALWTGEDSFIARLVPLLLPALRQLMIPFLFGLAADWLAEREFVMPAHAGPEKEKETSSRLFAPEAYGILVQLLHRGSGAETTCCFQRSDDGFFRLSEHTAAGSSVISRFMLPPGHRLARIAQNSREPVYIRADSGKERAELAPYRMPGEGEVSLWIIVSPVWRKNELKGFLLQDFRGDRPSSAAGETLQRVSSVMGERRGGPGGWKGTGNSFMPILVAACGSDGMDRSVQDMTAILADMITGATVSVAEVESADRTTRIWVSRGPLAGRRRGRKYDSSSGIADG